MLVITEGSMTHYYASSIDVAAACDEDATFMETGWYARYRTLPLCGEWKTISFCLFALPKFQR